MRCGAVFWLVRFGYCEQRDAFREKEKQKNFLFLGSPSVEVIDGRWAEHERRRLQCGGRDR